MKKLAQLTLSVFVMAAVSIGCRKEQDASLINAWQLESIVLQEITFESGVSSPTQAALRAGLTITVKEEISSRMAGETLEFRENNIVIFTNPDGSSGGLSTYSRNGNILTIDNFFGMSISGEYKISRNNLHWDTQLFESFRFHDADPEELGITSAVIRWTFNKR